MQKLIIKRSEWLRGEGANRSYLYRGEDSKRCCLGFLGNQLCGITDAQMSGRSMPSDLPLDSWLPKMIEPGYDSQTFDPSYEDTSITTSLSDINDNKWVSEEEREDVVSQRMAQLSVEVEFVD